MKYIEINLRSDSLSSLKNEILFEIASCRAAKIELICFKLGISEKVTVRTLNALEKQIRKIKEKGIIQVFANLASFSDNTTEAKFLSNKYPDFFEKIPQKTKNEHCIYIKL